MYLCMNVIMYKCKYEQRFTMEILTPWFYITFISVYYVFMYDLARNLYWDSLLLDSEWCLYAQ